MEVLIKTEYDIKAMVSDESCITIMTSLFESMAFCETIRSIVEPKQSEVVEFYKFKVREDFRERRGLEVVDTPRNMYLADESDWEIYNNEMIAFYKEQGLKHKEGCCPLLEAESLVREVKRHVVGILEPFTGISWDKVSWSLKNYEKYMDLMLTLFAPVVQQNLNQK